MEVIAVDRYADAPGHQVAHRAHVINMSDPVALRALIEQEKPHFVVPEIEAIATAVLLDIERDGIAEVIPTARAVNLTMNREGIRRLAAEELGLPTSPYAFADNLDALQAAADRIGYPCFIKPVMSSSGKGQSKVDRREDIPAAWDYAATGGRVNQGTVIVEGMIDFDFEITQLTVRAVGASGAVETFFCDPIGHRQVAGDYVESWQPQAMSAVALQRARDISQAVTDSLGGRGIFGVELFVKGDDVWFSEVSPRPHDTGLVTLASQFQSEFEIHAKAILGLPVNTALLSPAASAVIYGGMDERGIVFAGVAEALKCRTAMSACSASRKVSSNGGWVWRSAAPGIPIRPAPTPRKPPGASSPRAADGGSSRDQYPGLPITSITRLTGSVLSPASRCSGASSGESPSRMPTQHVSLRRCPALNGQRRRHLAALRRQHPQWHLRAFKPGHHFRTLAASLRHHPVHPVRANGGNLFPGGLFDHLDPGIQLLRLNRALVLQPSDRIVALRRRLRLRKGTPPGRQFPDQHLQLRVINLLHPETVRPFRRGALPQHRQRRRNYRIPERRRQGNGRPLPQCMHGRHGGRGSHIDHRHGGIRGRRDHHAGGNPAPRRTADSADASSTPQG